MENITLTTENGFKSLKSNEGYLITSFKEGDDIKTYYASNEVCMPLNLDENRYHSITLEEDKKYTEEKESAIMLAEETRMKEFKLDD